VDADDEPPVWVWALRYTKLKLELLQNCNKKDSLKTDQSLEISNVPEGRMDSTISSCRDDFYDCLNKVDNGVALELLTLMDIFLRYVKWSIEMSR